MPGKRFVYWTKNKSGEWCRHWTPLFDPPISLGLSESAKFRRRYMKPGSRNQGIARPVAAAPKQLPRQGKARGR